MYSRFPTDRPKDSDLVNAAHSLKIEYSRGCDGGLVATFELRGTVSDGGLSDESGVSSDVEIIDYLIEHFTGKGGAL